MPQQQNDDIKKWLTYYLAALRDGDRMSSRGDDEKTPVDSEEEIGAALARVFRKFVSDKKQEQVDVKIAPFSFVSKAKDGRRQNKKYEPFWVPAILDHEGRLSPPSEEELSFPWFVREALESPVGPEADYPPCGTLEDYDVAVTEFSFSEEWEEYWEAALDLFQKVTGSTITEFEFPADRVLGAFKKTTEWTIRLAEISGASKNVEALYEKYISTDTAVPSLVRGIVGSVSRRPNAADLSDTAKILGIDHVGQMSNDFPLSPSQRKALHSHLQTADAEILAVNGPPGTGKTTLLRSVVANAVVQAVLDEVDVPPLILASSTNNQAITNILENFGESKSADPIGKRWLPGSPSFGIYLAGKSAYERWMERGDDVPAITGFPSGGSESEWTPEYPAIKNLGGETPKKETEKLESDYLANARDALDGVVNLPVQPSLSAVEELLSKEIKRLYVLMTESIAFAEKFEEELTGGSQFGTTLSDVLNAANDNLVTSVEAAEETAFRANEDREAVTQYFSNEPFWLQLFAWLPPVRQRRVARFRTFLASALRDIDVYSVVTAEELSEVSEARVVNARDIVEKRNDRKEQFERGRASFDEVIRLATEMDKETAMQLAPGSVPEESWQTKLAELLDVTVRYRMFALAARLWEGRWISVIKKRLDRKYPQLSGGPKGRKELFAEMAHLTPLVVSTCQSVPKFFQVTSKTNEGFDKGYLSSMCDLVIMDEAGQVSPEVGLSPLFFGRRALIVGDTKQIEPVWNIASIEIDRQNLHRAGLLDEKDVTHGVYAFDSLSARGVLCSDGSIMRMAQEATAYGVDETPSGVMLTEHRRCVDEIIEFCNVNVYNGRLNPKVGSIESVRQEGKALHLLPAMGYTHIPGTSRKHGGSRENPVEARAVALLIKNLSSQSDLEKTYKEKSLDEIVAVVTPFRAQAELIRSEIEKELDDSGAGITVGTVHALQGAERPIILFAPVYTRADQGTTFFFDRSVNMLNVAVSRAKHHFIVVGDAGILARENSKDPSAQLGRLILSDRNNDIGSAFFYDSDPPVNRVTGESFPSDNRDIGVKRIDTLEDHRKYLTEALMKAKQTVVIVSPFISEHAINADGIEQLVRDAIKRNVNIKIYTDDKLDKRKGSLRESVYTGRKMLHEAGAEVWECTGIHNKSLAYDGRILIEGSFNWLSASRQGDSKYARYEVSWAVFDKQTKRGGGNSDSVAANTPSVVRKSIEALVAELEGLEGRRIGEENEIGM